MQHEWNISPAKTVVLSRRREWPRAKDYEWCEGTAALLYSTLAKFCPGSKYLRVDRGKINGCLGQHRAQLPNQLSARWSDLHLYICDLIVEKVNRFSFSSGRPALPCLCPRFKSTELISECHLSKSLRDSLLEFQVGPVSQPTPAYPTPPDEVRCKQDAQAAGDLLRRRRCRREPAAYQTRSHGSSTRRPTQNDSSLSAGGCNSGSTAASSNQQVCSRYGKNPVAYVALISTASFVGLSGHSLGRFVSQSARAFLATIEDISGVTLSAIQTTDCSRPVEIAFTLRAPQCCFDQRPAASYPVAVAPIHQLIGPSCKAPFRSILSR